MKKIPETYNEIHDYVVEYNEFGRKISKMFNEPFVGINISFVEKCLSEFNKNKSPNTNVRDFKEFMSWGYGDSLIGKKLNSVHNPYIFWKTKTYWSGYGIKDKDKIENLWLVVWNDSIVTPKHLLEGKPEPRIIEYVPLLAKFEPTIIDLFQLNEGWFGRYLDNFKKYILITGNNSKKEMLENVLKKLKETANG
jgi:hypothetical protein